MKRIIIVTIAVIALISIAVVGVVPKSSAAPPEGAGSPSVIVSPLDEEGNVKVSVEGDVQVDEPVEVIPMGVVEVHEIGPVQVVSAPASSLYVTADTPLPVTISQEPQLIKIFDNMTIYKAPETPPPPPGQPSFINTGGLDLKGYSKFKLYIKLTPVDPIPMPPPPNPPPDPPILHFWMTDSVDWDELGFAHIGSGDSLPWSTFPYGIPPDTYCYFATTSYFEGLYSEISLVMFYPKGEGPNSLIVNAWLLMSN